MNSDYSKWRLIASAMRMLSFYIAGFGALVALVLGKPEPLTAAVMFGSAVAFAFSLYVAGIVVSLLVDMAQSLSRIGKAVDQSDVESSTAS